MKLEEINKLLDRIITIKLENNRNYSGYAREIVMPEEDDETQETNISVRNRRSKRWNN